MTPANREALAKSGLAQGDSDALETICGLPLTLPEAKKALVHLVNCRKNHQAGPMPTLEEVEALEKKLCKGSPPTSASETSSPNPPAPPPLSRRRLPTAPSPSPTPPPAETWKGKLQRLAKAAPPPPLRRSGFRPASGA